MIELNQIYQEECIKFMDRLKQEKISVDVIVTSPPYNINKEYGAYKDNKERDEYLDWLEDVARSCYVILKDDGSFFLNIGGRPSDPALPFLVVERFLKIDYKLQNTIHWIKSVSIDQEDIGKNNTVRNNGEVSIGHFKPIVSGRYLSNLQEYVFHFTKSGNVKARQIGNRSCISRQNKYRKMEGCAARQAR